MVDSKAVIREWLVLNDGENEVLAAGVAAGDVIARRPVDGFKAERKCVCFWRLSGGPDKVGGDEPIFSFRCYGATGNDVGADAVARALVERLDGKYNRTMASGQLISSEVTAVFDMADLGYESEVPMVCVFAKMETGD